jgi:pyruvate kinase
VGYVDCTVMNTFTLGTNKGVNLPDSKVTLPAMSAQDLKDLEFGCLHKVDLIAASFTRTAQNVKDMREVLRKHGGERIIIIAKIENAEGLENAEAILEAADGLMVARGDMGVEINLERVCMQQKRLIRLCNLHQKPVVTATQMLETMQEHPRPTIAEVSDVTNAVLDGTDCVMLSGETAGGKFPVLTLQTMARICMAAESVMACADHYHNLMDETRLHVAKFGYHFGKIESFAAAAVKSAIDLKASAIIVVTETGRAARLVSKYCPEMPAIAYAQDPIIARQLLLSRAVVPIISEEALDNDEARVEHCLDYALENKLISKGSLVVVMVGQVHHGEGRAEVKAFIV